MNGKLCVAALAGAAAMVAYYSQDYGFPVYGAKTHQRLTGVIYGEGVTPNLDGLQLPQSEYPDLYKFKRQILVDDDDQEDAHYLPVSDGVNKGKQYWYKNDSLWETQLKANHYPTRDFVRAYTDLGYIVHIAQDSTVPAHDRLIYHGTVSAYQVEPGGAFIDANDWYFFPRGDDFEDVANGVENRSLLRFDGSLPDWLGSSEYVNKPFLFDGTFCDATRKIWLCPEEAAQKSTHDGLCAPSPRTWGVYSITSSLSWSCSIPSLGGDGSWWTESALPVVQTGMYLAVKLTNDALSRYSKQLPPVIASQSYTPFRSGRMTINLEAQENRKPAVTLSAWTADRGRSKFIKASVDGRASAPVNETAVALVPAPDTQLERLPYFKAIEIAWDGMYDDGSYVSGPVPLTVQLRDSDGNTSSVVMELNVSPPRYALNTRKSPDCAGCGVVSNPPPGGDGLYALGSQVCLTPSAPSPFSFSGWSGDLTGNAVPGCVTMNADKSVTAIFAAERYTLTTGASPAGAGTMTLSPAPDATGKYAAGTEVCATPVAAAGYSFSGWSGALTGKGVPGCVKMQGDRSITATFAKAVCVAPSGRRSECFPRRRAGYERTSPSIVGAPDRRGAPPALRTQG